TVAVHVEDAALFELAIELSDVALAERRSCLRTSQLKVRHVELDQLNLIRAQRLGDELDPLPQALVGIDLRGDQVVIAVRIGIPHHELALRRRLQAWVQSDAAVDGRTKAYL